MQHGTKWVVTVSRNVTLAIAMVGLLGPASRVESASKEPVVQCEVDKAEAAGTRAACLVLLR